MNRFSDITTLDWEILNALSDDYESVEQIHSLITGSSGTSVTQQEILDRLEYLHKHNYVFLTLNKVFDRSRLQGEIDGRTEDRKYWFGRTENGYLAWLEGDSENE